MTRLRSWRPLSLAVMLAVGMSADGFSQGLQNGVITADYPAWRSGLTGGRTILGAFGFRF